MSACSVVKCEDWVLIEFASICDLNVGQILRLMGHLVVLPPPRIKRNKQTEFLELHNYHQIESTGSPPDAAGKDFYLNLETLLQETQSDAEKESVVIQK